MARTTDSQTATAQIIAAGGEATPEAIKAAVKRIRDARKAQATPKTPVVTPKTEKPARWQPLDGDRAAWVLAHARPACAPCLCGCGETTKGRFFPGHDATLKQKLAATVENGTGEVVDEARAALAAFGWDS